MKAEYRGHLIQKTILGYYVDDNPNKWYATLDEAKQAINQLEIRKRYIPHGSKSW